MLYTSKRKDMLTFIMTKPLKLLSQPCPPAHICSCVSEFDLGDSTASHIADIARGSFEDMRVAEPPETWGGDWHVIFLPSIHAPVLTSSPSDSLSRVSNSNHGWRGLILSVRALGPRAGVYMEMKITVTLTRTASGNTSIHPAGERERQKGYLMLYPTAMIVCIFLKEEEVQLKIEILSKTKGITWTLL